VHSLELFHIGSNFLVTLGGCRHPDDLKLADSAKHKEDCVGAPEEDL
jgi:hypothetical protein